jgi:peptide/nickel transport system substrate-binding protein
MALSRRELLQAAAATGAGAVIGLRPRRAAAQGGGKSLVPYPWAYYANQPEGFTEKDIKRGGTFTSAFRGDPPHLDPALTTSYYMLGAVGPVYDRLIRPKWGSYGNPSVPELVPDLAERWEVSPDRLVYTFHLRRGVHWQKLPPVNGREFVAADVKYTLERWKGKAVDFLVEAVKSIETPDKYTVRIALKERSPSFFPNLGSCYALITPKEVVDRDGDLKKTCIGTGPFILKERVTKTSLTYERNPDFRDPGQPYLDRYRVVIIPDDAAQIAAFRGGELEHFETNDVEAIKGILKTHPKMVVHKFHIPGASFHLAFRLDGKPFSDVRVRRAISMAINRDEMNQLVYAGQGRPYSIGIPWPAVFDDWPKPEAYGPYYRFDPKRAKALLQEAGYGQGFKTKLVYFAYGDDRTLQCEMVQNYLRAIGIQVEVARLDYGVWVDQYLNAKYEGMALGFTVPAGGMELGHDWTYDLLRCKGVKNSWHICDPELDKLLDAEREEVDPAKRRAIFRRIWDLETGNVYRAYVAQEVRYNLWYPYVKNLMGWTGYRFDQFTYGSSQIRTVWIDPALKGGPAR